MRGLFVAVALLLLPSWVWADFAPAGLPASVQLTDTSGLTYTVPYYSGFAGFYTYTDVTESGSGIVRPSLTIAASAFNASGTPGFGSYDLAGTYRGNVTYNKSTGVWTVAGGNTYVGSVAGGPAFYAGRNFMTPASLFDTIVGQRRGLILGSIAAVLMIGIVGAVVVRLGGTVLLRRRR